jgi:N utilization substance protein B
MQPAAAHSREIRPANKRGAARLAAVQALYQMDVSGGGLAATVAEYENHRLGKEVDGDQYVAADPAWFRVVTAGVVAEQQNIDPAIQAALPPEWPLARLDMLLLAVLRAAVFELMRRRDVPAKVVVNEYLDVARAFFGDEETGLINRTLDRIARVERPQELPAEPLPGPTAPEGQ